MELLIRWLASLFSSFKAKNPLVAGIVLLALSAIVHTVHQGSFLGLFPVDGWLKVAIEYISLFLTAVTGSKTWEILNKKK